MNRRGFFANLFASCQWSVSVAAGKTMVSVLVLSLAALALPQESQKAPATQPSAAGNLSPSTATPGEPKAQTPTPGTSPQPAVIAAPTAGPSPAPVSGSGKQIPPHTPERLAQAKAVDMTALTAPPYNPSCPTTDGGKAPTRKVQVDWDSGSISPSNVDHSGPTCFEVHNFNDILYQPSFTLSETPPSGSAFDLLKDALTQVSGLLTGAGGTTPAKQPAAAGAGAALTCPALFTAHVQTASGAAANLQSLLSQVQPSKDSSGKFSLIDVTTTVARWQPVPKAYNDFQSAVGTLETDLGADGILQCDPTELAAAESVIIDGYLPTRQTYPGLAAHVSSPHIARFTGDMEATSNYVFTVKTLYPGGDVNSGTKTFSLSAGRKILSSSGGFLITELPAPSYSSVTAPVPPGNTSTQNVLGVNDGNGPRPALTALLNFYLPSIHGLALSGKKYGLALSAGPVFDISNGKANTSRIGVFSGVSLHLWNQLFITPGVHIGEFAGFPQGYTAAGQVIPPNSGTPAGVSRYTARFGLAITFKIKDFGQTTTKASTDTATNSTPNTGTSPTPAPKGKKSNP